MLNTSLISFDFIIHFFHAHHFTQLQQRIPQCAIDRFFSFLHRWIPLIESYNLTELNFYHMLYVICVLEAFNCKDQKTIMRETVVRVPFRVQLSSRCN